MEQDSKTTHFGYQTVDVNEKEEKVAEVFHSVASKYDIMNDFMSFGIHRLWKRIAISKCSVKPNQTIVDLASGTGDLAKEFARLVGKNGSVIVSDINDSMLKAGKDKLLNEGVIKPLQFVLANAEKLPFPEDYCDCVTIAFGLRNITDKQQALNEMYRILKPGGRVMILEFSHPTNDVFAKVYDTYSFTMLPLLGKLVANDADSYRYLAESIRMHPDQETLKSMLEIAGFENCSYENLTGGVTAIHMGFKF